LGESFCSFKASHKSFFCETDYIYVVTIVLVEYFRKQARTSTLESSVESVVLPDENGQLSKEVCHAFTRINTIFIANKKALQVTEKCEPSLRVSGDLL